ncbi:chromosome partitioning protein ParB, partial [Enterococcus faecalis]
SKSVDRDISDTYFNKMYQRIKAMNYSGKQAFSKEGLFFYNDMILLNTAGSAALRARQSMNNRKVVRIHQNVLVFYKGNPQKISKHFEALETLDDELETVLESLDE